MAMASSPSPFLAQMQIPIFMRAARFFHITASDLPCATTIMLALISTSYGGHQPSGDFVHIEVSEVRDTGECAVQIPFAVVVILLRPGDLAYGADRLEAVRVDRDDEC